MPRGRDPFDGSTVATAQRPLAKSKPPKPKASPQEIARRFNVTARCGDGCLDKLVVSVRHKSLINVKPVVAGVMSMAASSAGLNGVSVAASPAQHGAAGASAADPLLLLGILSGSAPRREMLRCSWMRVDALTRNGVRVLFIVGKANAEDRPDVLPVDVVEGAFMRSKGDAAANKTRTFDVKKLIRTGSVTTYWKLVEWLKYAATQPEPMVGRADDDVFISPRMLIAHARLLHHHANAPPHPTGLLYAGVYEWYSWRTRTLMSTGFGLSAGASRTRRKKAWRNCSATGERTNPRDPCAGPVAFAKGPLMLMSRRAAAAVVASPLFARDVSQARRLSNGEAEAYHGPGSGRIDDDVQLGYWMSQLPGLHVVTFRRYMAWHDRWKAGVTDMLPRLLVAHKVPWGNFADLLERTEALWRRSPAAETRVLCEGPPCADCAHLTSQHACVVDIELTGGPATNKTTCWPKCKFTKATPPELPAMCWNGSSSDSGSTRPVAAPAVPAAGAARAPAAAKAAAATLAAAVRPQPAAAASTTVAAAAAREAAIAAREAAVAAREAALKEQQEQVAQLHAALEKKRKALGVAA